MRALRRWAPVIIAPLLAATLVGMSSGPPDPVAADGPADAFSAVRAAAALGRLLGDGSPHPVASPANARFRGRLIAELEGLGVSPEVQRRWVCGPGSRCARVHNVVATLPGVGTPWLALSAHYDSVPAGPGAGDDGAGVVTVLETARALLAVAPDHPGRAPVVLLFTDGEEAGMLGARAFGHHRLAAEVDTLINVEARGTSGLSLLFETGEAARWIVDAYAAAAPRPATSSLYQSVYEMLPNDTDFTIHRERGVEGANFGFIDGLAHYHTSLDDLAHLNRGSLQHQGDSVLSLATALLEGGRDREAEAAVYFDLLGVLVVRVSVGVAVGLSLASLLLLLVLVSIAHRRGRVRLRQVAAGLGAVVLGLAMTVASGLCARSLVEALSGHPAPAWADATVHQLLYGLLALLGWLVAWASCRKALGAAGLWLGVALMWVSLAAIVALWMPGFSHLFAVPALASTLAVAAWLVSPGEVPGRFGAAACWLVTLVMWLPVALDVVAAVGLSSSLVVTVPAFLMLSPATFLADRASGARPWRGPKRVLALALVAAIVASALPSATEWSPHGVNIVSHYDTASANATHYVEQAPLNSDLDLPPLPPALQTLTTRTEQRFVMPLAAFYPAAASLDGPALQAPAPTLTVLDPAEPEVVRLQSRRGAWRLGLCLPAGVDVSILGGPASPGRWDPRHGCRLHWFFDASPVTLVVSPPGGQAGGWIFDETSGSAAEVLEDARGAAAVPVQQGDRTLVFARL